MYAAGASEGEKQCSELRIGGVYIRASYVHGYTNFLSAVPVQKATVPIY